jgi:hypothetical protein
MPKWIIRNREGDVWNQTDGWVDDVAGNASVFDEQIGNLPIAGFWDKAPTYNHLYTLAFSVVSQHPKGEDVTPSMFRDAIVDRMADLDCADEWEEAIGPPHDTYKEESA